eukprot:Pompholyxophrys_sp_v1_NODE_3_length_18401_cov_4.332280.p5 type:complete len:372 gc:universal NODE_3_length_18401_cov_4.332280:12266-11151(-)
MTGRHVNELMRIYNKYPDKLSQYSYAFPTNPNFQLDRIAEYLKQTIRPEWSEWEGNPNVSLDYIKSKHITRFNHWRGNLIIQNPNITLDYVKDNQDHINYKDLSYNPSLNINWVLQFPNADWDWGAISANPNITPEIILAHDFPWNWYHVSRNPSISMEFIENNPNWKWDNYTIGMNPNIDIIHIKRMICNGVLGNECGMFSSASVSIESLISLLNEPRENWFPLRCASTKPILTPSLTLAHENWFTKYYEERGKYYYKYISLNPNMTLDHIKWLESEEMKLGIKILDWEYLSRNKSLKLEWIDSYPDKGWDWHCIAANSFQQYYPKRKPMNTKMQQQIKNAVGYRPQGRGYCEARDHFNILSKLHEQTLI